MTSKITDFELKFPKSCRPIQILKKMNPMANRL